jgi:hypothetical protein
MMLMVGGVAMPVAMYLGGCSSTATGGGFGNDEGGTGSSSGKSSSSSGSSGGNSSSGSGGSSSGGNTSSSGGGTSSSGGNTSSSGGGTSSSGGGTSSSGSSGGTDAECANPDADACSTCCANNHATGYNTYETALGNCECTSPGTCATQCSGACSGGTETTACQTCIEGSLDPDAGGACYNPLVTACNADPDCVALLTCANTYCP